MKKYILLLALSLGVQSFLWSNPIDGTPFTKFSELVFDNNNNWTMEILFSPGGYGSKTDSIVIVVSNISAKLKANYPSWAQVGIITADSLTVPLVINRSGDKILIYTYSYGQAVRMDSVIFGNYPYATIGAPINGYSIIRNSWRYSSNYITITCLTNKPSLGVVNDTTGLTSILTGNMYDANNNLVTKLKVFPSAPSYFVLETPITIDSNGTYSTKIFPITFSPQTLTVRLADFGGWIDYQNIESFELKDIHPDTVVIHDIHLMDNRYVVTSVDKEIYNTNDELALINYPNPFNLSTNFFIKLPNKMKGKPGNINIYSVNGQLIRTIQVSGSATILWDSKDMNGRIMPSGVYYYRLVIDKQVMKNGSMILLK
ncbi:MAG: T9SS type A sorting domain-containing protein [Bacteroidetes bacterium]|nr:T9SS type A sorting domain-containing protein [Bacteroidota bacterium]